jgi:transketolase
VPCQVPFELPEIPLELGVGTPLREGVDALFIGYGPTLLSEAWRAAVALEADGLQVGVVNLPWLNQLSPRWLLRTVANVRHVFSLDNHHATGGQGDRIADVFATSTTAKLPRLHRFAVEGLPACGGGPEVLGRHGLDSKSLRQRVLKALSTPRAQAFDDGLAAVGIPPQ